MLKFAVVKCRFLNFQSVTLLKKMSTDRLKFTTSSFELKAQGGFDGNCKVGEVVPIANLSVLNVNGKNQSDLLYYFSETRCNHVKSVLGSPLVGTKVVQGQPGSGKSVEVFAITIQKVMTKEQPLSLLYVHGVGNDYVILQKPKDSNTCNIWRTVSFSDGPKDALRKIEDILCESVIDVMVVDGTSVGLVTDLWHHAPTNSDFTICTSFQALRNINQESLFCRKNVRFLPVDSWTKEEFLEAVAANAFPNITSTEEAEERWYLFGSYMRLQSQTLQDARLSLELSFSKIESAECRNLLNGSATTALNSLQASYFDKIDGESTTVLCSEYITMRITRKVLAQDFAAFINRCRLLMPDNCAWQGWISQAEFTRKIEESVRLEQPISVWNTDGTEELWPVTAVKFLNALDSDQVAVEVNTCSVPLRFNQGCLDGLIFLSQKKARMLKVTDASKHAFKWNAVEGQLVALGIKEIEVVVVCRKRNFMSFAFPPDCHAPENQPKGVTIKSYRKVCYEELAPDVEKWSWMRL